MSNFRLVDTNILVYAHDDKSPDHQAAKLFLEGGLEKFSLAVSVQNFLEYFSVVTNPKNKLAVSSVLAGERILKWLDSGFFKILSPTTKEPLILTRLLKNLGNVKFQGPEIFDVYLGVTMIANDINIIYTADPKIFRRLGLKAINPL